MNFRIVTDSSSNVLSRPGEDYGCVPLKIVAGQEYVDVPGLNVTQMVEDLKNYKGKSGSSCPNVGEWLEAFGDAQYVFGITITKHLSGSYNAYLNGVPMPTQDNNANVIYLSMGYRAMMSKNALLDLSMEKTFADYKGWTAAGKINFYF